MAEDEPKYATLKNAARGSGMDLTFLRSMVNSGFIGTGVHRGTSVMLDIRWIPVLKKAWEMLSNETPVMYENVLRALDEMAGRMTTNIECDEENLKRGHQYEDLIKKQLAQYKRDREFFLAAINWCNGHLPKIIG